MLSFLKGLGSGIQSKYSISNESFRVGPWSVHDAKVRSSGEPVSVFIFDKSSFSKSLPQGVRKSVATAAVTDFASRGVSELSKLRHPSILRLIEPLETSSKGLMFVSERLTTSFDTLVVTKRNESLGSEELNDLAIERGALVLCQGLRFLHEMGRVHSNLGPQSVFVAANGDWKIGGLEFLSEPTDDFFFKDTDPRLPNYLRLNLDFMAPEVVLDHRLGPENDVWALASLLYTAYTLKEPLDCRGNPNAYKDEYTKFSRKVRTLPPLAARLPSSIVVQLFERNPTDRLDVGTFEQTDYFNHSLVKALQFIDDFETKSDGDKAKFLSYLQGILNEFPKAILRRKILQFVILQLSSPATDDPCTRRLSNILFGISSGLSQLTFTDEILPLFKKVGSKREFQASLIENVGIVVAATNEKNFAKSVVPVFEEILKKDQSDKPESDLKGSLLNNAAIYVPHLSLSNMEQKLFPLTLDVFSTTQIKSNKLACIGAFSVMISNKLSTMLVTDKLLPALESMKTRDPTIVMAVKELYDNVSGSVSSTVMMEKIIPHLASLSLSRDLAVNQLQAILKSVRDQLTNFEKEQVKLLSNNKAVNNTFDEQAIKSAPEASKDDFMNETFWSAPAGTTTTAKPKVDFFDTPEPEKPTPKPSVPAKPAPSSFTRPLAPLAAPTAPGIPPSKPAPKAAPQQSSFLDDFGSFQGTQQQSSSSNAQSSQTVLSPSPFSAIQPISKASQPSQTSGNSTIQTNNNNNGNASNYSSPFLVSSLKQQPAKTTPQPQSPQTPQWTPLQPLQPTKKS